MATTPRYFSKGIELRGETADLSTTNEGTIFNNSTSAKLKAYIGAAIRELVTADQVQILTNKSIDAASNTISNIATSMLASGVLNTSTSLATASNTQIPSALAVKTYVDTGLALQNDAVEIAFVPNGDISSTNVQAAVQEVRDDTDTKLGLKVDKTTTVNGHALSANVTVTATDVGLGNVDNTSDATKNAAAVTLTNKTIVATANTITAIANANIDAAAAIARTKLASGTASALLANNGSGVMSEATDITVGTNNLTLASTKHLEIQAATDSSTTGANASLTAFTGGAIRLTNASLTSLANIPAGANGQQLTILNRTGVDVQVIDSSAATGTAANRIYTGTNTALTFTNNAALYLQYDSTSSRWQITGGSGSGGGSSSLSSVFQLVGTEAITDWSTGNNATFLGGGSLAATFAKDTSTPLHGSASYKLTQAGGSLNDYVSSPAQAVDLRFRGQQTFLTLPYQYNGATSDIAIVIYDVTNSAILSAATDVIIGTNGSTSSAIVGVIIPSTCASIRVGFQVKVLNSGKILAFDDVQLSTGISDVSSISTTVTEAIEGLGNNTQYGSTNTGVSILSLNKNTNLGVIQVLSDAVNGTSFKALKNCELKISCRFYSPTGSGFSGYITRNATTLTTTTPDGILTYATSSGANNSSEMSANVQLAIGDIIRIQRGSSDVLRMGDLTLTATAESSAIVTPLQQVSSDTLTFAFKSTAIDPTVDAIGTFNTYTFASVGNAATIATSAPTQTTTSMNTNGIQVFSRAFSAASTSASPARFDIFIGKGLKSKQVDLYASAAKVTPLTYDRVVYGANVNEGGTDVYYNELTGILVITAGVAVTASNTGRTVDIAGNASASGYFVFNASRSPSLSALPNLAPRIAYLSHSVASGTAGGSATSGSWQTRTLNTLTDTTGIVTSLSSNQFILSAGTYSLKGHAVFEQTDNSKTKIRNITDSTDTIIGSNIKTLNTVGGMQFSSLLSGEIIITSAKTFELQSQVQTSVNTTGYGIAASFSVNEVYAQLEILKIK